MSSYQHHHLHHAPSRISTKQMQQQQQQQFQHQHQQQQQQQAKQQMHLNMNINNGIGTAPFPSQQQQQQYNNGGNGSNGRYRGVGGVSLFGNSGSEGNAVSKANTQHAKQQQQQHGNTQMQNQQNQQQQQQVQTQAVELPLPIPWSFAQVECEQLLQDGHYTSCELLAMLILSRQKLLHQQSQTRRSRTVTTKPNVDAMAAGDMTKTLEMLGDCSAATGDTARAAWFYRQAEDMHRARWRGTDPYQLNHVTKSTHQPAQPTTTTTTTTTTPSWEERLLLLNLKEAKSLHSMGRGLEALAHLHRVLRATENLKHASSSSSSLSSPIRNKHKTNKPTTQDNHKHTPTVDEGAARARSKVLLTCGTFTVRCHGSKNPHRSAKASIQAASSAFLEVIRYNPYHLQVLLALIGLGVEEEVIQTAAKDGMLRKNQELHKKQWQQAEEVQAGMELDSDPSAHEGTAAMQDNHSTDNPHENTKQTQPGNIIHPLFPIHEWISAHVAYWRTTKPLASSTSHKSTKSSRPNGSILTPAMALAKFVALEERFPNNVCLLERMAMLQYRSGDYPSSETTYNRIRQQEPHLHRILHHYAELLHKRRARSELNRLAGELLESNDRSAVSWICLALHYMCVAETSSVNGNGSNSAGTPLEKALSAVDRALVLSSSSSSSSSSSKASGMERGGNPFGPCCCRTVHKLRGMICMAERRTEEALPSFRQAAAISCAAHLTSPQEPCCDEENALFWNMMDGPEYTTFEGLVECYLACGRYREASMAAREYASSRPPRDAGALTLVGMALSHTHPQTQAVVDGAAAAMNHNGRERAKRAYRRALAVDPKAFRPLFALADLLIAEGDLDGCVELLRNAVEEGSGGVSWASSASTIGSGNGTCDDRDLLHVKLAMALTLSENYSDAMTQYHIAISLRPDNVEAQRGMDRLEKLMKGQDPMSPSVDDNEDREEEEEEEELYEEEDGHHHSGRHRQHYHHHHHHHPRRHHHHDHHGYEVEGEGEEDMEDATNFEVDAGARGYL